MTTDFPATLPLLLWVAVGIALVGHTCAFKVAIANRKLKQALKRQQSQFQECVTQSTALNAAHIGLAQTISALECEVEVEKQKVLRLNQQLERVSEVSLGGALRIPRPATGEAKPLTDAMASDNQAKSQLLEASLEKARHSLEASEHALRQSNLVNQKRQLEIATLASQVDDLALNLEETRTLVAEKERATVEMARREREADGKVAQLRANEAHYRQKLEESLRQLKVQKEVQSRADLALQQAHATVHEWKSNAGEIGQQLATLSQELQDRQTAYVTLKCMLQDTTAAAELLRGDVESMTSDRKQLELQNIELKNVLAQICGGLAIRLPSTSAPNQGARVSWPALSESDIQRALLELRAMPGIQAEPYRPLAKATEIRLTEHELSTLERELRDARLRLRQLESGMGDIEYLREQNAKLRDELLQDRGAARELTALQLEHKRLKLDLYLAEQKLSTQFDTIEALSDVASELQDHKEELEALGNMRVQLRDLRAENFALQNLTSGTYRVSDAVVQPPCDARELTASPLETAVLSDHLGLPVAATGNLPAESLAAVSGIAAQAASRVRELVPIGSISTVQWTDQYGMTVICRLFKLAGDEMAMTTLTSGNPSEQVLKQTLKTVLESIGWNEDGPQADVINTAVS